MFFKKKDRVMISGPIHIVLISRVTVTGYFLPEGAFTAPTHPGVAGFVRILHGRIGEISENRDATPAALGN
jgi:hypothetical protein